MREALMIQLERFSYYQHLSLSGGKDRPIFASRIVDIRGTRFHVLSRIQDSGLDFTGRTNFIAHHLVFTPEELRQNATPPVILRNWTGWLTTWTREAELLEQEDWSGLFALASKTNIPAQTWEQVSGDAVNGYGLLEARSGASFSVDDQPEETVLSLMAESLELLETRDPRKDFRTAAWQYTFTTSMQEQDNPADFRWRCIHSDNPAATRLATPDGRALSAVRATKVTAEETTFARNGRQPPKIVTEPKDVRITEGETARFIVMAEGVPGPTYQWFTVDRANAAKVLADETNPELVICKAPIGVSRYLVGITNSLGTVQSQVARLSVEKGSETPSARTGTSSHPSIKPSLHRTKSEENFESRQMRLDAETAQEIFQKRLWWRRMIAMSVVLIFIFALAVLGGVLIFRKKNSEPLVSAEKTSSHSTNPITQTEATTPLADPMNIPQTNAEAFSSRVLKDEAMQTNPVVNQSTQGLKNPPNKNAEPSGFLRSTNSSKRS
jgi:hypothetical protein